MKYKNDLCGLKLKIGMYVLRTVGVIGWSCHIIFLNWHYPQNSTFLIKLLYVCETLTIIGASSDKF